MEKHEWKQRLAVVINGLAATYSKEVSKAMLTGYGMGLADLPIESIERGAASALRASRFMPTVAEIREHSGHVSAEHRAVLAWQHVDRALVTHGYYRSVSFDDPVINGAVRAMGGWIKLCTIEERDFAFAKRDFERAYKAIIATGLSAEAAAPLVGYHEQHNRLNGYDHKSQRVRLIATDLPPLPPGIAPPERPAIQGERVPALELKKA